MHPRRKNIEEIKEKSVKCLNEMVVISFKQKIIEEAKGEVAKCVLIFFYFFFVCIFFFFKEINFIQKAFEMNAEVEKVIRENEILKKELEKLKDTIVELQT